MEQIELPDHTGVVYKHDQSLVRYLLSDKIKSPCRKASVDDYLFIIAMGG
jgi:hypothetical protein